MSQKIPSDGAQKGFAVGRGLLAAAETLNFSMSEHRSDGLYGSSSRSSYGMAPTLGGGDSKERDSQLPRHSASHLSNTMKLFNSLGLSPTDLDALAQVPEENISVETLPHLIMQLKSRKAEASRRSGGNSRDLPSLSPERSYRGPRGDWEDVRGGRVGGSGGQALGRGQQDDYDYTCAQDGPSRGYDRLEYGESSGGSGSRDRPYSELSRTRDRYGGFGMGASSASDSVFMTRRTGCPSQGKVQDFLGVMPQIFPHVCSLCDFDVHSTMEWTQHTNGLRHLENRRLLLQVYPDWRPHEDSDRVSGSILLETTNRSAGLLGPAPGMQGLPTRGMASNWGPGVSNPSQGLLMMPKIRSRVVVARYERKPLTLNSLLVLAEPFGTVCEHIVLNKKAFLEMQTHEEAVAMVTFYLHKPAVMHGKKITFYLSQELVVIEKGHRTEMDTREVKGRDSQVVFFSNLPREQEKKMELLTLARHFGTVEKHLFLNEEAFIQLGTPKDARMMVKYYTLHPLTIDGRSIRLNICTKYKTLIVNPSRSGIGRPDLTRKSSTVVSRSSSRTQRSPASSDTVSKVEEETAVEEEELQTADAAVLEEGSGDEVAGVMEGDEDEAGDQAAETSEPHKEEPESAVSGSQAPKGEPPTETSLSSSQACDSAPESAGGSLESQIKVELADKQMEKSKSDLNEDSAPAGSGEEISGDNVELLATEPSESVELCNEGASVEQEAPMDQDFPENMDDFVTLDEVAEEEDTDRLDTQSKSGDQTGGNTDKSGGFRVVNVVGFKRGYNFLDEILTLAKPFGKVVRHLVLDVRPEAFLELSSEEEARAMVDFYSANVTPMVCGKAVKIYHSQTYATIQSGRVIYVGQLPSFKTSDASLLKIAEPFGKVRRYFLNRNRYECFIEMERGEDAERMANAYKENPPKFQGKRLTVYVSRKYKQLKHGYRPPPEEPEEQRSIKREHTDGEEATHHEPSHKAKVKKEEEPLAKRLCVREESATAQEPGSSGEQQPQEEGGTEISCSQEVKVNTEELEEKMEQPSDAPGAQKDREAECKSDGGAGPAAANGLSDKSSEKEGASSIGAQAEKSSAAPLGPYQPNNPVGVEYMKMGYYCRVCFLFYSNEETAKKVHCSSLSHYEKLKKHLEKEKETKGQ
ncbi:matrin-3-like isoform X2 [Scleropages formosus]|uniref:matrin-3-like isoform X2 n=1 Tax=Scleropages formosus TaxID=113540 RepID=UPI0010FA7347|nr:matrin-3-like isoform X2 [Scleropages formosus]